MAASKQESTYSPIFHANRSRDRILQLHWISFVRLLACSVNPPWISPPDCNILLEEYSKYDSSKAVLLQEFEHLRGNFGEHVKFHTDGLKTTTAVSCAIVTNGATMARSLYKVSSVFVAEVYVIILNIGYIFQHYIVSSVMYTDSPKDLSSQLSRCGSSWHSFAFAVYLQA